MVSQVSGTLAAPDLSGDMAQCPSGWPPPITGEFPKAQAGQVTWPQVSQSWPLDTVPLSISEKPQDRPCCSSFVGRLDPELMNQDMEPANLY